VPNKQTTPRSVLPYVLWVFSALRLRIPGWHQGC
jgi:hypothetical protein